VNFERATRSSPPARGCGRCALTLLTCRAPWRPGVSWCKDAPMCGRLRSLRGKYLETRSSGLRVGSAARERVNTAFTAQRMSPYASVNHHTTCKHRHGTGRARKQRCPLPPVNSAACRVRALMDTVDTGGPPSYLEVAPREEVRGHAVLVDFDQQLPEAPPLRWLRVDAHDGAERRRQRREQRTCGLQNERTLKRGLNRSMRMRTMVPRVGESAASTAPAACTRSSSHG
jgi:hypothetical protein